jgi:hypothetical protein
MRQGEVAAEVAHGVKRTGERNGRNEQHHPGAQGVGAEEFAPLGNGAAGGGQHRADKFMPRINTPSEGRQVEKLDQAARPREQAEQPGQQRHKEDGGQQHRRHHLSWLSLLTSIEAKVSRMRKTRMPSTMTATTTSKKTPISTTSGMP